MSLPEPVLGTRWSKGFYLLQGPSGGLEGVTGGRPGPGGAG